MKLLPAFGARRISRIFGRRFWVAAAALAIAAGAVVVAARQDGFTAQGLDLGAGSVWVSSTGPGQLALLDGAAAEVTVRVAVAGAGEDLLAVQGRTAGYAVNRTQGTITRVDTAPGATPPPGCWPAPAPDSQRSPPIRPCSSPTSNAARWSRRTRAP